MKRIDFALVLCDPPIGLTMSWFRQLAGSRWDKYPVYSSVRESIEAPQLGVFSWLRNPA